MSWLACSSSCNSLGPNASRLILGWNVDLSESPHFRVVREHDRHGKLVSERYLDPAATWGAPWLLNHRVTLHKQLFANAVSDKVPGQIPKVILGKKVVSASTTDTSVTLEDGTVLKGDLIIAADGIRSAVQQAVVGNSLVAKPSGHSAYRCLIPGEAVKADAEWSYLFVTPGVNIFVAEDRRIVAYTCCYQGRDFLNIVAPCPDKSLVQGVASKDSWSEKGSVEELVKTFSDFSPSLQRLLSYTEECGLWQLRDQDPLVRWHKGQVVLIGDAAHPMLPHLGQGGSQAIEDADMLGYLFKDLDSSAAHDVIEARLQRFFELRWERATFCQENSREQALGGRGDSKSLGVPLLNPLKTSQYLYNYIDGETYAAQKASDGQQTAKSIITDASSRSVPALLDETVSPLPVSPAVPPQVATI